MIEVRQLEFAYPQSTFRLSVESLEIDTAEQAAIVGPSGCGKTTLLELIAGIIPAEKGCIQVNGTAVSSLSDQARRAFRIENIGLVFQEFELIDYLNVRDNILLPYRINRSLLLTDDVHTRVEKLADDVGISDKLHRRISKLSQGERQRTAICRALLPQPKLLLADEPTGNLDPHNKRRMIRLLSEQAQESNASLIVVTHDHSLLDGFNRVIDMNQLTNVDDSQIAQVDPAISNDPDRGTRDELGVSNQGKNPASNTSQTG